MDKETLSNYGWIVICVLVLAVMIALATPFGTHIKDAVWNTTNGLFDVNQNALDIVGIGIESPPEEYPDEIFISTGTIALPTKMYAFVGQPIRIYYQNIISLSSLDGLDIRVDTQGKGTILADRWEYTPTQAETITFRISIADGDGNITDAGSFEIEVKENSQKQNLSVLVIGDSTINAHTETGTVLSLANSDSYNLTLLGTRGTIGSANQHEGRGGWTAEMYCTRESAASGRVVNPFYNTAIDGTNKFDFEYYMTTQDYDSVDCVVFQLGINDIFAPRKDSELTPVMQTHLSYMQYMVNNIHAYDPNIKVVLNLIIPCSYNQEHFDLAYESGAIPVRTAERCKVNSYKTNLAIMQTFNETSNVYISHFNSAIARENYADHVHPTTAGYSELGTQLYSFIRAIN